MSSSFSSEMVDSGKFSGKRTLRSLEKSNFSQTCTLLSHYLKEKGSFGDLGLGMAYNHEGNGIQGTLRQILATTPAATMNLFPQHTGFASATSKEELLKKVDSLSGNRSELGAAQMTIFYAGQVMVFDDFPSDKAKEIMFLASKSSQSPINVSPSVVQKPVEATTQNPCTSNFTSNFSNNLVKVDRPVQPTVSDLPIARKASLTRFLEKRKDRRTAQSPYPTKDSGNASSPAESKAWLGLGAQSQPQPQPQPQPQLHL